MTKNSFDLCIEVNGRQVPQYFHDGKCYVEGRKGSKFVVRFKNNSSQRVHVVPAIDGKSVTSGEPASDKSSGYIVGAYESLEVKGWRTSLEASHKFEFSGKDVSYAGKTDGPENCGIISVLVFGEKEQPKPVEKHIHHWHKEKEYVPYPYPVWPRPYPSNPWHPWRDPYWDTPIAPIYTCSTGGSTGSWSRSVTAQSFQCSTGDVVACNAMSAEYNLGTAFGEVQSDVATEVAWENGSLLCEMAIYYTDKAGLKAAGIDVERRPAVAIHPQGFPGRFCKPPPETAHYKKSD